MLHIVIIMATSTTQSNDNDIQSLMKQFMEIFAFNQVIKYDGTNINKWIISVRSAFQMCEKEHFLCDELPIGHHEYYDYQRYFGLLMFTFEPKILQRFVHLKTVFQLWDHMVRFEQDSLATSVRKFTKLIGTKYDGGKLCHWFERLTAQFEDIESEWLHFNEKTRCTITISLLPRPQFDHLIDRLTSIESLSMMVLMNIFIDEDKNMKTGSTKCADNQFVNKKPSLSSKRNKCGYCKRNGHNTDECYKRL